MIGEYLRKQVGFRPAIARPPSAALAMAVVIPCKDEPDLRGVLASLAACDSSAADGDVEVLVVVNGSDADPPAVRARNAASAAEARAFAVESRAARRTFHVIEAFDLPERHAGVGLARKLGMDEALARLDRAGAAEGVIACLDADCAVAPDYLRALRRWFAAHPGACGAAIHFEHRLSEVEDPRHRAGIAGYELFLRSHVHGLRLAGCARAFQTVGSSLAVRARAYAAVGGMNRRKAGEDFYFVQKLASHGAVGEIQGTTVYPSGRVSNRVPFGTGRAMGDWLASGAPEIQAYDPRIYRELAAALGRIDGWFAASPERATRGLPTAVAGFLEDEGFAQALRELQANTTTPESFGRRMRDWLNPFRCLKLVHALTRTERPKVPVTEAARSILAWEGAAAADSLGTEDLLAIFRALDRGRAAERSHP